MDLFDSKLESMNTELWVLQSCCGI